MSIAAEDVADGETGDQKPSDGDQLTMTDYARGEQDSRPNNKPEDLLELIMTADEFQKPEESSKKKLQHFSTKRNQAVSANQPTSN